MWSNYSNSQFTRKGPVSESLDLKCDFKPATGCHFSVITWVFVTLRLSKKPGELALSCNPSYWEARIVGWLEVERSPHSKPIDFWSRTMATQILVCPLVSCGTIIDEKKPGKTASPSPSERKQVRAQAEYSTYIARPYSQYCNVIL
jgi:hypothetical protein